jgi:hypothetical protein
VGDVTSAPRLPGTRDAPVGITSHLEHPMEIHWQHDLDKALASARGANKPVLLDFSAAPM